ncbi:hypothetical protein M514_04552, partial [Trichuris suis]
MDNRGHLIRQEMERFEHEINQQIPSMLPGPAGPPSLRFLPHSLQHRPFVPLPMAPRVPIQGRPMFAPPLMQPVLSFPGAPAPVVMESLPARYSGRTSATISAPPMPASKSTGEDGKGERLTTLVLSQDVNLVKSRRTDAKSSTSQSSSSKKQTRHLRTAGGVIWEDVSLSEWDPNDFRLFCGDLGNEVSDELLAKAFRKYSSFIQAKILKTSSGHFAKWMANTLAIGQSSYEKAHGKTVASMLFVRRLKKSKSLVSSFEIFFLRYVPVDAFSRFAKYNCYICTGRTYALQVSWLICLAKQQIHLLLFYLFSKAIDSLIGNLCSCFV